MALSIRRMWYLAPGAPRVKKPREGGKPLGLTMAAGGMNESVVLGGGRWGNGVEDGGDGVESGCCPVQQRVLLVLPPPSAQPGAGAVRRSTERGGWCAVR